MQANEKIDNLINDFSFFDSWEEKYEYIIDMGKKLPPMADALKTEQSKVKGCMSQVWLVKIKNPDNTISIIADSDAIIVKGLIAILLQIYNGETKQAIQAININQLFTGLGLDNNLAATRRNGLASMIKQITSF